MGLKIAARMLVVVALCVAMTAAIMALRDDGTEDASSPNLRRPGGEPERSELLRCRDLGMAAADDPVCRKAWAESRRRFLEQDKPARPVMPAPERFGDSGSLPKPVIPPLNLPVSP